MAATQKKESALDDPEQRTTGSREAGKRRPDWRREEDGRREAG
jgi:hypothetical protein